MHPYFIPVPLHPHPCLYVYVRARRHMWLSPLHSGAAASASVVVCAVVCVVICVVVCVVISVARFFSRVRACGFSASLSLLVGG